MYPLHLYVNTFPAEEIEKLQEYKHNEAPTQDKNTREIKLTDLANKVEERNDEQSNVLEDSFRSY